MNTIFRILLSLFLLTAPSIIAAPVVEVNGILLKGKVIEKKSGDPLTGVSVYLPDLKTGTVTDKNGFYKIDDLPPSKVLINVSLIGYKMISAYINLDTIDEINFELEESITEMNEIVVTGLSHSTERSTTPVPITTIAPLQLKQIASTNLIDAIATQPGVAQVTTGVGISKPVIRGLGYNRVVVINDGVRQEGQQWGDEHGIEIDENSVYKVEILKGPASLAYGSDALAGVINLFASPTLPSGSIHANVLLNYQTNNGLMATSLNAAGNQKGLVWDLRYSAKMAHAYKNRHDGYVFNSGFKENSFSAVTGLNRKWGYSHLIFSKYQILPGIVEGSRDSITGNFTKEVILNDSIVEDVLANNNDFKSYDNFVPYQLINHYKVISNSSFVLGNGNLKTVIGWQQNQRQEYDNAFDRNQYGLYLQLNTINYDLRYNLPEINSWNISAGINGMLQQSTNKGIEFLIPDYNLFDYGLFGVVQKSFKRLNLSGGIRYDRRNEQGKNLFLDSIGNVVNTPDSTSVEQFKEFQKYFNGLSGSLGATYQFNETFYTKLNVSRGFRAPNISELASNGIHEGTMNYLIGNQDLKTENSLQTDVAFGINSEHLSGELSLFYNSIDHYIFQQKLPGLDGNDSITDGYVTYKYAAGNAQLGGGELSFDLHPHPLDWLHFENTLSYVIAVQRNKQGAEKFLPQIPAPRMTSELRADFDKAGKILNNVYFRFEVEYTFRQDNVYNAFNTETATPEYLLLNIGTGADIVHKLRTLFSIYISVSNLTNVAYQNHLSRLKYAPENYATGRTGVFNMGRNFSFKLIVPINISN